MSTRRTPEGLRFDHGCQYFSAKDVRFLNELEQWHRLGLLAQWNGRVVSIRCGQMQDQPAATSRYVGVPTMRAVCEYLAQSLNVTCGVTVKTLQRSNSSWELLSDSHQVLGRFNNVIVAIPAPQAAALLSASDLLRTAAESVQMTPCWTVMTAFDRPLSFPADAATVHDSPLSWIARSNSKPGRGEAADCWVLQASADWSRRHIDLSPEIVSEHLLRVFETVVGEQSKVIHLTAHRWRYALPEQSRSISDQFDSARHLGICGDWCLGNRVEAAFLSGLAVAKQLCAAASAGQLTQN